MKERLNSLLSEVGESFDHLRSDVRNLSQYMAELEDLIESYRAFTETMTFSTPADRATQRRLLKRTHKIIGPAHHWIRSPRRAQILQSSEDLVTE